MEIIILSTETNPVVAARSRKLKVECIQGCDDKLAALQHLVQERGLSAPQVAYVGNDVNDLHCMHWVGCPIAVADAVLEVRTAARLITNQSGGYGAVREVCEWLLAVETSYA
jgi:YrbI family 3-deoxy-D-manno-octulosonate 8-phosphate phosphatase